MPWSIIENVPSIINEVQRLQPARMIELGVGFGKYGTLCRETLDGMYGRCQRHEWQREIYGIEIHEQYRNPCWAVYNAVEIGDFSSIDIAGYDLVLMVDSLEHLEPESGHALLARLVEKNNHVIISVPNGPCLQGEVYGNSHERHLTTFHGPEFDSFGGTIIHRAFCIVVTIQGKCVGAG